MPNPRPRPLAPALLVLAAATALACDVPPAIVITSPSHGAFTTASSVTVDGVVMGVEAPEAIVTVNGTPVAVAPNGTFSAVVALDTGAVNNPIVAELVDAESGVGSVSRIVVIAGASIPDGDLSPQSTALRVNDTGLDALEGSITGLVDIDPSSLVAVGAEVLDECVVEVGVCLGSARVTVVNPPPSFSGFSIATNSRVGFVEGDVSVSDLSVNLFIDGSGIVPNCPLTITADTTTIFGDYALQPQPGDPTSIDVNLLGTVSVSFANFEYDLDGICDDPLIGDIIQLFLPDIQSAARSGFQSILNDPDGGGPQDAPIADAVEVALGGIEITGPIGDSLGLMIEAPLFAVDEDNAGITLGSDTKIVSEVGGGPGQCLPPPGAPNFSASYHVPESFPALGATSPGGMPYDVAIAISSSAFNQLMKASIECGLLQLELAELDIGTGPIPLTTSLMGLLIPEFGILAPGQPLRLGIQPTLAPIVTGSAGPGGELGELKAAQVVVEVRDPTPGITQPLLQVAVDFRAGLEFAFDAGTGQLAVTIPGLNPADVSVTILDNLVGTDEATLQAVLPTLLAVALPQLAGSLGSFPLPEFVGLGLFGVEVAREGQFMSIYLDLVAPTALPASADAYVRSGQPTVNFGTVTDLFIQTEGSSGNNRVGYARFDLSGVAGTAELATVEFTVSNLIGSGASFSVYGLPDGHPGEGWSETGIVYNNAPLVLPPPAPLVDVASTFGGAPLGTFSITAADVGQPVGFTSAALKAFVNGDTDNRVTLILVRDTDNAFIASLFATKENATLAAPTLKLVVP